MCDRCATDVRPVRPRDYRCSIYPDLHKLSADEILRRMIESGASPGSPFFEVHTTTLDRAVPERARPDDAGAHYPVRPGPVGPRARDARADHHLLGLHIPLSAAAGAGRYACASTS